MKSKWVHLKPQAITLRKDGQSIGSIETKLGIPRSTLSGWFKDIKLTKKQKDVLRKNWEDGLKKARLHAVQWHNKQKENRLMLAKSEAHETITKLSVVDLATLELALAVLYLAEGSKKNPETALGSSDPATLRFFLKGIEKVFGYDVTSVRCELYLRADQNPEELKVYWSKKLHIPIENFKQVNVDIRSAGKPTYDHYKGVCSLRCGNIAIRRRLVFLAEEYFDIIARQ